MRIIYFLLLFAALRTATERQEGVVSQIDQSVKEPNWDHKKYTSSRSLIMAEGATSSDDYAVFLKELSALGRILNGLTLDRQLRKGQLDVVQVVSEMTGIAVNETLIDELSAGKWTDAEQAVEEINTQLAGFGGATWQDQKISDGLTALGTLVDKVKPTAETLDVKKIKTVLEAVTELKSLDYTLLDGNPVAKILEAFQHLITVPDPIPSSEEGKVMTSVTTAREQADVVEKVVAMIETAHAKLEDINTRTADEKQVMTSLFSCVDKIKNSGADGQKLNDFKTELGSFDYAAKKLIALGASTQSIQASVSILEHYLNAFLSGHQVPIKLTLGLPHGLADLDAISSDLRLSRNQKLISAGGNLTALEGSFSRITSTIGGLKETVNEWKSYHTNKKDQATSLDVLKTIVSDVSGFSSPTSISTFVDFVSNVQPILAFTTAQTTTGLGTAFDAWEKRLIQTHAFLTTATSRKDLLDRLKDLSALKQVLRSGRNSAESLRDFKGFKDQTNVNESLAYMNNFFRSNIGNKLFEEMYSDDNLIITNITELTTLKDWLVGVKEFQKPDGLDESLISTRKIVGDVQKLDAVSLNFVKEVIVEAQKMKTSVKSIRSQTAQSKSRARRQVTIDGWTQLDALSSTIGHAVRSAMMMSPTDGIAGKLEKLSKASKELDEALKMTTDQRTRSEVENEWKGYGSIEAEVSVVQNQVKKVVESVPKKLETLKDLAVVVEKMTLVYMKFTKATVAAGAVKRIPTTSGDRNVKQKVEEVQKALDETLLAHMSFVSHYADLTMGADALDSISSFFATFFGISKDQATVSNAPESESGSGIMAHIGIGVAVLVVVVFAGLLIFCCIRRKTSRKSQRSEAGKDAEAREVEYWMGLVTERVAKDRKDREDKMKRRPRAEDAAGGECAMIRRQLVQQNTSADRLRIVLHQQISKSSLVKWLNGESCLNKTNKAIVCEWWRGATDFERKEAVQSGYVPAPIKDTIVQMSNEQVGNGTILIVYEKGMEMYCYQKQKGAHLKVKWMLENINRKIIPETADGQLADSEKSSETADLSVSNPTTSHEKTGSFETVPTVASKDIEEVDVCLDFSQTRPVSPSVSSRDDEYDHHQEDSITSTTSMTTSSGNHCLTQLQQNQHAECELLERSLLKMAAERKENSHVAENLVGALSGVIQEAVLRGLKKCDPILVEGKKDIFKLCDDSGQINELMAELKALRVEMQAGPPCDL